MKLQCLKPRVATISQRIASLPAPSRDKDYRIRGRTLQTIRDRHFNANPLCVMCLAKGIVAAATELDHIIALTNGGSDTAGNRQGLCAACHQAKTLVDLQTR